MGEEKLDRILEVVEKNTKTIDKIIVAVLDNKQEIGDIKVELKTMRENQDRTYLRIDEFMTLIDRHEAEIAALRAKTDRLEERLAILEQKVA